MKKLIWLFLLVPALSWAQNSSDQDEAQAAPGKSPEVKTTEPASQQGQPQAQEENKNAVINDLQPGPFDRDGKYNFLFDKKEEGQQ